MILSSPSSSHERWHKSRSAGTTQESTAAGLLLCSDATRCSNARSLDPS